MHFNSLHKKEKKMKWFYELLWLWKCLGISLLISAVSTTAVALISKARNSRLRVLTGIIIAVATFIVVALILIILSNRPVPLAGIR